MRQGFPYRAFTGLTPGTGYPAEQKRRLQNSFSNYVLRRTTVYIENQAKKQLLGHGIPVRGFLTQGFVSEKSLQTPSIKGVTRTARSGHKIPTAFRAYTWLTRRTGATAYRANTWLARLPEQTRTNPARDAQRGGCTWNRLRHPRALVGGCQEGSRFGGEGKAGRAGDRRVARRLARRRGNLGGPARSRRGSTCATAACLYFTQETIEMRRIPRTGSTHSTGIAHSWTRTRFARSTIRSASACSYRPASASSIVYPHSPGRHHASCSRLQIRNLLTPAFWDRPGATSSRARRDPAANAWR